MTDIANLSETMRQGEATRAALGVQLRARPLWSGAGRLSGVPAAVLLHLAKTVSASESEALRRGLSGKDARS